MTVRPALLWRLSNFPSSCESLLPWRRSPVACGLPLRYVPPLDVSSFVLPSDRMRASWSLPLVVSPCELRAYYSTRRDSSDAQSHARIVGIEESIGGIDRDCGSWCAYSSWNIAVTRPEIRGSTSPRIPIIAIQDDFSGMPGSMSNGASADALTATHGGCGLWAGSVSYLNIFATMGTSD